jgi:hypothetical protein
VDGLVGSYGTQRLRIYRMPPELGPPDLEEVNFSDEDASWAAEWEHLVSVIVGESTLLGSLDDAHYAWSRTEEAYSLGPFAGMREGLGG